LSLTEAGTPPAAVVNFYGPMDFGAMDADMQALGRTAAMGATDAAESPESILMGMPVGENRAEATAMGPVGRLAAKTPGTPLPPLMIRHGDADPLIAHLQAERLKEAWARVDPNAPLDFALLPSAGHGGSAFDDANVQSQLAGFLARHLGVK
jgi:acetyl esterase/lipase